MEIIINGVKFTLTNKEVDFMKKFMDFSYNEIKDLIAYEFSGDGREDERKEQDSYIYLLEKIIDAFNKEK